jgi:hypothetical protein
MTPHTLGWTTVLINEKLVIVLSQASIESTEKYY